MNGFGYRNMWNPWRRLWQMEREMGRLFDRMSTPRAAAFPPVNVYTDSDGATVTAELPGVDPAELDITVNQQTLVIGGERKAPESGEGDTWHRRERVFGQFTRSIDLPFTADADSVEATYRDGVLEVRLHRREADKPKQITVQS